MEVAGAAVQSCPAQSNGSAQPWLHGKVGPSNSPILIPGRSALIRLLQAQRDSRGRFAGACGSAAAILGSYRFSPTLLPHPRGFHVVWVYAIHSMPVGCSCGG